ncbi:hypothetical protein [Fusobacterium ulcerans]|uniref:Uncharacterized protein n=1 Tax=Fusobacterium ulcerans 12-1B TaxID=457404 RepID=H1PVM1_9FUSO|nr:hypothetical protein [Fusobacterium ulcerans]EHO79725.1 hypothetical protein HMPREF0402_02464 [Fusobacterium ulcerans 12-1B]
MTKILEKAKEGKEIKVEELSVRDFKWLVYVLYCKEYTITISNGILKAIK